MVGKHSCKIFGRWGWIMYMYVYDMEAILLFYSCG